MDWMRLNKLKVKADKIEVILVSQKADQVTGIQSLLDGVTFPLKTQVRNFNVFLDSSLSLDAEVSAVTQSALAQLR